MWYFCAVEEKEKEIVASAGEVFMKLGIKSVNMDDVARNLRISKKTLYKYVKDKNDLIRKALELHFHMEDVAIDEICHRGLNAIDESLEISRFIAQLLRQVHPSIHFDLEKYHPEIWKDMLDARHKMIYKCMHTNITKGIKDGLYRKDLNADVITKMYISKMDVLFDGELFPHTEITFEEVYLEYFRYHIRGLASEEGMEYLVNKVKKEKLK